MHRPHAISKNQIAFDVGADHARYGLRRPRTKDAPREFLRGFDTYKGPRRKTQDWATNKWLALRLSAIKRNFVLTDDVTPDFLNEIAVTHCPVTLASLTRGTGQDTDCSIDRIISNGGYAQGNIVAMSVRANQAKGDLSFDDVARIALSGDSFRGLTQKEWARLLTIMLGAQVQVNKKHKDLDIPLCTALPPHIFIQPVQLLQAALLSEAKADHMLQVPFWRAETYRAKGDTALYDRVRDALRAELATCDYPYDAWFRMRPFWPFMSWFHEMQPTIALALQRRKQANLKRYDEEARIPATWATCSEGRYSPSSPAEHTALGQP